MIVRISIFVLIIISGSLSSIMAQLKQTSRFELEVKRSEDGHTIIPVDTLGMVLLKETDDFNSGERKWELVHLDKNLEVKNEALFYVNIRNQWIGYEYHGSFLYLLFREGDFSKSDLYVLRYELATGNLNTFQINNEIDFQITHFTICNETAVMGGYVKQRPTIILYVFDQKLVKAVPNYYLKDSKLIDITVNLNNTFNVLISNEQKAKDKQIELKVFDDEGNELAYDIFKVPDGKEVISGMTSRLKNENLIVAGLFSTNNSNMAEGVFWAKADLSQKQTLSLIPLTKFSSLYDHLPEKKRERYWDRASRKIEDDPFFEREHVYLHRMLEGDDRYYLLMEIFDPNTVRPAPLTNSQLYSRTALPFTYYQNQNFWPAARDNEQYVNVVYDEAIITALDKDGQVLWDHAVVMDDIESGTLEQISDFSIKEDDIAVAYKNEDELYWSFIDQTNNIQVDSLSSILLKEETDELKNDLSNVGNVKMWYDGVFFVWGYQSIKRLQEGSDERLYVFYINKLEMVD